MAGKSNAHATTWFAKDIKVFKCTMASALHHIHEANSCWTCTKKIAEIQMKKVTAKKPPSTSKIKSIVYEILMAVADSIKIGS